jgi:hypothetical protein
MASAGWPSSFAQAAAICSAENRDPDINNPSGIEP